VQGERKRPRLLKKRQFLSPTPAWITGGRDPSQQLLGENYKILRAIIYFRDDQKVGFDLRFVQPNRTNPPSAWSWSVCPARRCFCGFVERQIIIAVPLHAACLNSDSMASHPGLGDGFGDVIFPEPTPWRTNPCAFSSPRPKEPHSATPLSSFPNASTASYLRSASQRNREGSEQRAPHPCQALQAEPRQASYPRRRVWT